jgi:hypothetical protein
MDAIYTTNDNINVVSDKAKKLINMKFSDSDIVFLKEFMQTDGTHEEMWTLFVFVKKNDVVEKHCYIHDFDYNDENTSEYNTEEKFGPDEEEDLMNCLEYCETNNNFEIEENYDLNNNNEFSTCELERVSMKGKEVINTLPGECIYVREIYSWGDCDEDGPTEHMWTLYVTMSNCTYYKFYREVFEMHGQKDEDINYEEEALSQEELNNMGAFYEE